MKGLRRFMTAIALSSLFMAGETIAAAALNVTQTVAGGSVTAKVTFLNPKDAADPRFQVMLDTHSLTLEAYD